MLEGKVIVITGANGVLGRAAVDCALGQGAVVVALDRDFGAERGDIRQFNLDLTDAAAVNACVWQIDKIDVLFNVAGGFAMGPAVHETTKSGWDAMFAMNVTTMRNMCAAVVPVMLASGGGSIVNVGAFSAREGQGNMGAYCVAKSSVMRLTESLSKELREQGINVNAVLPSIIDTPTNRADMPGADFSRWVAAADIAGVMCFLASDAARAMHGALVPVVGLS